MAKVVGFMVVEDSPMHHSPYRGIAQSPVWPLDSFGDPVSILLSNAILDVFCANPVLNIICSSNHDLISQYLQHCQNLGISTKLFWIEAYDKCCAKNTRLFPSADNGKWLGIDYISSADASYLFDDGEFVFQRFSDELSKVKANMTPYGLFNSFSDAISYAEYRATLDTETEGIEHSSHEVFAAIYQII